MMFTKKEITFIAILLIGSITITGLFMSQYYGKEAKKDESIFVVHIFYICPNSIESSINKVNTVRQSPDLSHLNPALK